MCSEGPWFKRRLGQGEGQKQYCYTHLVPMTHFYKCKHICTTDLLMLSDLEHVHVCECVCVHRTHTGHRYRGKGKKEKHRHTERKTDRQTDNSPE